MTTTLPAEEYPVLEVNGALATITFNRPHKFNAFHLDMVPILRDMLYEVERKQDVRCVLFKGKGKHFMAGGDMSSVLSYEEMTPAQRMHNGESPPVAFSHIVQIMTRMPKPIVASVQGAVAGAAIGFICACDLIIAGESSFYWAAHVLHGGSNDGCLSYFLPRVIGHRKALEMDPRQPEAQYNLGYLTLERGQAEESIPLFLGALEADPKFSDAYFNLAMAFEQAGQAEKAQPYWRSYVELEPHGTWSEIARRHL